MGCVLGRTFPRSCSLVLMLAFALGVGGCGGGEATGSSTTVETIASSVSSGSLGATGESELGDIRIPEHLFDAAAGTDYFESWIVDGTSGDWVIATTNWTDTSIPVPAGWWGIDVGEYGNWYLFNPDGDIFGDVGSQRVGPAVAHVKVSMDVGSRQGDSPVEGVFEQWSSGLAELGTVVHAAAQPSSASAYILWRYRVEDLPQDTQDSACWIIFHCDTTDEITMLIVFAGERPGGWGAGRVATNMFSAATASTDWIDYYPIFRIMVEHWTDADGSDFGIDLPDTLGAD